MLQFHCYRCGESFKIANKNLYNKIALQCPNCDNPIPDAAVHALRRYSESYLDLIDVLYHTNTVNSAWGISIIGNEESIPKKPDYFDREPDEDRSFWEHRNKPFEPRPKTELTDDEDLPF